MGFSRLDRINSELKKIISEVIYFKANDEIFKKITVAEVNVSKDLSFAISKVIDNIWKYRWQKLHLSNSTHKNGITWYEFTKEIFRLKNIKVNLQPCKTEDFPIKAKRPNYSKLINNSDIELRYWRYGVEDYLNNL